MKLAKPLVIGANGQVGASIVRQLEARHGKGSCLQSGRTEKAGWLRLDLEELRQLDHVQRSCGDKAISAIFCVGGYTWVDGAEADRERAFQINTHAPVLLARYAHQQGIPFLYFSTEYVFAGLEEAPGPYDENDPVHPLNVYGESKLEGEQGVLTANPDALVVRTTVVYGEDAQRKNYLYTVLHTLAKGEPLSVANDQVSTPTYNVDLARGAIDLIELGARGIYHVAGPEAITRFEFASRIARAFSLDSTLLRPVRTSETEQRAKRPLHAGLGIRKLQNAFPSIHMRSVDEVLTAEKSLFLPYLQQLKSGQ